MLMHLAVPQEFECIIKMESGESFDELSEQEIRKRWGESYEILDSRTLNFQFLASLKQFFKEKSLDFSPMLKQIFKAIEKKEKATEASHYESAFWQLIQMLFAGFYLESNPGCENFYIRNFFEVEIKVDILLLRMVLDLVSKCLKQVEPCDEAFENSNFLNSSQRFDRSSILDAIDQVEREESTEGYLSNRDIGDGSLSSRGPLRNAYATQPLSARPSGSNFSFKIDLQKTKQQLLEKQYEEEEEEEFMREDDSTWDIIHDAHKIARREQILEKRKKAKVEEELSAIRSDRVNLEEQSGQ